jgi:hypothetical protein
MVVDDGYAEDLRVVDQCVRISVWEHGAIVTGNWQLASWM